jgi:hypothetical protein
MSDMHIEIDGVPHNWTIRKMAKKIKMTERIVLERLKCLGIKGRKPGGRILFTEDQAKKVIHWK